jgi:hypothetical protein
MHGPTFPALLTVVDDGVAVLQRAGFGERTAFAYGLLINNALQTIAISDDRLDHEGDGPRDHAAMMEDFRRDGAGSTGLAVLAESLVLPFLGASEQLDTQRAAYYRFVVDTTIAGLAPPSKRVSRR